MIYQPLPYQPPFDGEWTTRSAFPYEWERPGPGKPPWIVDRQARSRGFRDRFDDPDFNPFDPRPWPPYRGVAPREWTSPGPFYDPPSRGAADGALNPGDFASGAAPAIERPPSRLIEHLSHCSKTLTRCGDRLARATSDAERRAAALDGHAAISYVYGLLASEGISPPPIIFGETTRASSDATRGNSCKEAGEFIEKMIEKYSKGSRGLFSDIGEGIDKLGGCYGETKENLSK